MSILVFGKKKNWTSNLTIFKPLPCHCQIREVIVLAIGEKILGCRNKEWPFREESFSVIISVFRVQYTVLIWKSLCGELEMWPNTDFWPTVLPLLKKANLSQEWQIGKVQILSKSLVTFCHKNKIFASKSSKNNR